MKNQVQKQKSFFAGCRTKVVIAKAHRIVPSGLWEWAEWNRRILKKYKSKIAFRADKTRE